MHASARMILNEVKIEVIIIKDEIECTQKKKQKL